MTALISFAKIHDISGFPGYRRKNRTKEKRSVISYKEKKSSSFTPNFITKAIGTSLQQQKEFSKRPNLQTRGEKWENNQTNGRRQLSQKLRVNGQSYRLRLRLRLYFLPFSSQNLAIASLNSFFSLL